MPAPTISHLQAYVLNCLTESNSGEVQAKTLREMFRVQKISQSLPGFYQMMARMKKDGLVTERKDKRIVAKQIIRESFYRPTLAGYRELGEVLGFYRAMM